MKRPDLPDHPPWELRRGRGPALIDPHDLRQPPGSKPPYPLPYLSQHKEVEVGDPGLEIGAGPGVDGAPHDVHPRVGVGGDHPDQDELGEDHVVPRDPGDGFPVPPEPVLHATGVLPGVVGHVVRVSKHAEGLQVGGVNAVVVSICRAVCIGVG